MNIPEDRQYTREHEWILVDDGIATIGVTDFAQSELGDIVFIELPDVGDVMSADDTVATIEAVKTVADLFTPFPGKVVEVNERLAEDPDLVNRDPYGEGWIVRIEVDGEGEVGDLLEAAEYNSLVEEEGAD